MKLVTLETPGGAHPGVIIQSDILDLSKAATALAAARILPRSVRSILAGEDAGLDLVRRILDAIDNGGSRAEQLRQCGALVSFPDATLLAPVPNPAMILSCGTNYPEHVREMGARSPKAPGAFLKATSAIIGTGAAIVLPPSNPDWVDYEGEFSFVIGRPCHRVTEDEAMNYIAGYTLVNDVSARDWARLMADARDDFSEMNRLRHYNVHGKNFPTFCPIGPVLVTKDEIPDPHAVTFETLLNAKRMQLGNTNDLIFSIPWLLAEFSKFYCFQPGDIITTGSPSGVGFSQTPRVFFARAIALKSALTGSAHCVT